MRESGGGERRHALQEACEAAGVRAVLPQDPDYPERLRRIELPPPVLFVRGVPAVLDAAPAIAAAGTRRPSDGGRHVATRVVAATAGIGAGIVSGLAVGIDGVAHDAALRCGVPTVAVIGGGHLRLYPRAHDTLARRIVEEGWPGWWGLESPGYLAWLEERPDRDYTLLMGANTYRVMSDLATSPETPDDEAEAIADLSTCRACSTTSASD